MVASADGPPGRYDNVDPTPLRLRRSGVTLLLPPRDEQRQGASDVADGGMAGVGAVLAVAIASMRRRAAGESGAAW